MSDNEKSLSDEATLDGGIQPDEKDLQSLGDRSTLGGNDGSSISDHGSIGDLPDHDMEIVDLSKRYRIEKSLGKGGMGEVLLATDTRLDRKVAIKRIRADVAVGKTAAARFLHEAKAVAALSHNNVVAIHDFGRDEHGPFLIMEYVSGGSLLQRCKEGPIELEQAVDIACQICDGLGRAHDAGIIHRDIKPANILLTHDGVPKLTDFGLAKADSRDHTMTMAGAVLGTLDFMPPEQRRDAALTDSRSDLWSLAASLYQMVTGEGPKVIRLKRVPEQIRDVLDKALEESKDERFQASLELRDALRDSLDKNARGRGVALENLDEGQCLSCGSRNPSSRKFCKECAASLMVSCLKCEESIPVWEKICGECGCVQEEILEQRREAMKARRNDAEECLQDLDFDGARTIATEIQNERDVRLSQLNEWSTQFLGELEARFQGEQQRAADQLSEAQAHEFSKDYTSASRVIDNIAKVFWSDRLPGHHETVDAVRIRIDSIKDNLRDLEQKVKQKVKQRQLDSLMADVERLIDLAPHRQEFWKLKEQLITRAKRAEQRQNELFLKSRQLLEAGKLRAAHEVIKRLDHGKLSHEQISFQHTIAELLSSEEALISAIKDAKADGVLTMQEIEDLLSEANRFLSSVPKHAPALNLISQLTHLRDQAKENFSRLQESSIKSLEDGDARSALTFIRKVNRACRTTEQNLLEDKLVSIVVEEEALINSIGSILNSETVLISDIDDGIKKSGVLLEQHPTNKSALKLIRKLEQRRSEILDAGQRLLHLAQKALEAQDFNQCSQTLERVDPVLNDEVEALELRLTASLRSYGDWKFSDLLIPDARTVAASPVNCNSIGMALKTLPPLSGSDTSPCLLGVHAVTQEQYELVMGSNPSKFKNRNNPVDQVTWDDATLFCCKLSEIPNEKTLGRSYRLPTEIEWEAACRAGSSTAYSFGDDESDLEEYGWYSFNSRHQSHPVGQKKPNTWGFYDMHGNIWEWCNDAHADPSFVPVKPSSSNNNDRTEKVLKGGSWSSFPNDCRSSNAMKEFPFNGYHYYGFRVLCFQKLS